jgi:hypothetical protein
VETQTAWRPRWPSVSSFLRRESHLQFDHHLRQPHGKLL